MHKNNIAISLMILALSAALAAASYQEFTCGFNPPNVDTPQDFRCVSGASPRVWCSYDDFSTPNKFFASDCAPKCAKACGQLTVCLKTAAVNCETCCSNAGSTCGGKGYPAYSWTYCFFPTTPLGIEACSCHNSCIGTCETNTSFCNIKNLLYIVVGIAAAVMLSIHGLMWIKSEDAHARNDAKNGMWYVIVGVIIIVMASVLVGFLLGVPVVSC